MCHVWEWPTAQKRRGLSHESRRRTMTWSSWFRSGVVFDLDVSRRLAGCCQDAAVSAGNGPRARFRSLDAENSTAAKTVAPGALGGCHGLKRTLAARRRGSGSRHEAETGPAAHYCGISTQTTPSSSARSWLVAQAVSPMTTGMTGFRVTWPRRVADSLARITSLASMLTDTWPTT